MISAINILPLPMLYSRKHHQLTLSSQEGFTIL